MKLFLKISGWIDALSERVGRYTAWLIVASLLISATNAAVRKAFDISSNAYLEVQWYLFSAAFLLASGYTLLRQEHVRIDVILGRFSRRTQVIVEVVCFVVFLMPFCLAVIYLSWPLVERAWVSGEMSQNAGGLIRWPVFAMVPAGFLLLLLQGFSELIKRLGFLAGQCPDPAHVSKGRTAEEELAEFVRSQASQKPL